MLQKVEDLRYNPKCDVSPVDQMGFVDLADAFFNRCIPENVSLPDAAYNNIDDPEAILGRPHDVFDAARFNATIHDYEKKDAE